MNAPAQQMAYSAALRMLAGTDFKGHSARVGERDNWLSNILYSMGKGARLSKTTITKVEQAFPMLPALLQGGAVSPYPLVGKRATAIAKVNADRKANKARATESSTAIMDRLAELDGKLNLLLIELGCNGAST